MIHERESRRLAGTLLGISVGEALGLPYENLSPWRGKALLGEPDRYHFVFGRGMVADDAELSCITAQSLVAAEGDVARFRAELASRLRGWLLSFPLGGGAATYAAAFRLCLGWTAESCGGYSAGNAPATRAVVLGAAIDDLDTLQKFVQASTMLTHTDPVALHGAMAIALAARMARESWPLLRGDYLASLRNLLPDDGENELLALIDEAIASAERGDSTTDFAASQSWQSGVSGYILPTVAAALHAVVRYPQSYRDAVMEVIRCGGDADSTAAIVGGILATGLGRESIPPEWIEGLWEPQRSVAWIEELASAMAARKVPPPELSYFPLLGRNLIFAAIVFYHIFRRLLPPYW